MRRSMLKWVAIALVGVALGACSDEGVGDPCIPEAIPCEDDEGKVCGFQATESYIESSSVREPIPSLR
jgi:nitrous oxide reductase accessory protein NosL